MPLEIRQPISADYPTIFDVVTAAFGRPDEARLVEALRRDGSVVAECVVEIDGHIVGHALCSQLAIERNDGTVAAAALAPVAVHPSHQNCGIGGGLIEHVLALSKFRGAVGIIVLGHASYYPRFGFSANAAAGLTAPFSGPSFMAIEFVAGAFADGRAVYAPAFGLHS